MGNYHSNSPKDLATKKAKVTLISTFFVDFQAKVSTFEFQYYPLYDHE